MQHPPSHRGPGFLLLAAILTALFLGPGCAQRVYRAANLPPELMAPATLDPQCINLSGLADQSVSAEVIQPGDVLDVTMITDYTKLTTTTAPVRVADDGSIVVPLVGRVGVGGMEVKQAEQVVNAESIARGVFRTPCITVTMKQCHTSRVTVLGRGQQPGRARAAARIDLADGGPAGRRGIGQGGGHGSGNPPHRLAASAAGSAQSGPCRGHGRRHAECPNSATATWSTSPSGRCRRST